jgi:hypothetical protein
MKNLLILLVAIVPFSVAAQETNQGASSGAPSVQAPAEPDDVEVVSMNGSVTRAKCPYTCEMRGIPRKFCREWKSRMYGDRCYVQDTRLPSNAVPIGGDKGEGKKPANGH